MLTLEVNKSEAISTFLQTTPVLMVQKEPAAEQIRQGLPSKKQASEQMKCSDFVFPQPTLTLKLSNNHLLYWF